MEDHEIQEQAARFYFCSLACGETMDDKRAHDSATPSDPEEIPFNQLTPNETNCWNCDKLLVP